MNINNTDFSVSITNFFKKIEKDYDEKKEFLNFHQYIVRKYIVNANPEFRGLLIYFTTGQGKTFLATSIAEYYRGLEKGRKVIVLSAKSLAQNFYDTTIRYMTEVENMTKEESEIKIKSDYKFISSNASNMIQQLENIYDNNSLDKSMITMTTMQKKNEFLNNSLIIVDEAHNIFNAITSGSKIALQFYDIILKTKNVIILFLTGTPIINNVFELVPCFNMLFGYSFFPEIQEDFDNWFIDEKKKDLKNKKKFTNYLTGRITYYGTEYFGEITQKGFPVEFPINIVEINMSMYQYSVYNSARIIEKKESSRGIKSGIPVRFGTDQKKITTTYRVRTRQISNYAFPAEIYKNFNKKIEELAIMKDRKEAQKIRKTLKKKMVEQLTEQNLNFNGLKTFSPKMLNILDNINSEIMKGRTLGMVYSEFVSGEGLAIFARILKTVGWNEFNVNDYKEGGSNIYEDLTEIYGGNNKMKTTIKNEIKLIPKKYTFALISGEISPENRNIIIKVLNSPENSRGGIINILLLSGTGAEGLDLKGIRHIHIMDPYWNMARIKQIKARGIRFMSHEHLNVNERNVQVYIYLSVYPQEVTEGKKIDEPTTDKYIYMRALDRQIIIDKFLKVLVENSMDCSIHKSKAIAKYPSLVKKNIQCKICQPNNKILYHKNLREDLNMSSPCIELDNDNVSNLTEQITAKELVLEGNKKVYYVVDPPEEQKNILSRIHVYEYKPALEGYTELSSDSIFYPQILEKILQIIN